MSEAPTSDKISAGLLSTLDNQSLEKMLLDNLHTKFPDTKFVSYIVKIADEQGWTSKLIREGLKRDPQNALLKEFALLDPLQAIINSPPDKSKATANEVERALRSLVLALKDVDPSALSGQMFAELHGYLASLYVEYDEQTAATIA